MKHVKTYEYYNVDKSHDVDFVYNQDDDGISEVVRELMNFLKENEDNINFDFKIDKVEESVKIKLQSTVANIDRIKIDKGWLNKGKYHEITIYNNVGTNYSTYSITGDEFSTLWEFCSEMDDNMTRKLQEPDKKHMLDVFNPIRRSSTKYNL